MNVPQERDGPVSTVGTGRWRVPTPVAIGALFGLATVALRLEGRRWWCRCGRLTPWMGDIWGSHTSQHLFDPYSFTHVEHGLIFWGMMQPLARWIGPSHRLLLAMAVETLWEIVENTQPVINNYRKAALARGYEGDSVANSLGDIAACGLGLLLARRLPVRWSVALFVATEVILLAVYRDNLLFNITMQFIPIKAVEAWQMGR
jgi:Protein of unknown function (DUF2585)